MANEFEITALIEYEDSEGTLLPSFGVEELLKSITTKKYTQNKISVGFAAEEAIPLGELAGSATRAPHHDELNRDAA